jgi:hypothetical protein
VQVDPIKPALKAPGSKRLKLKYAGPLSDFTFNIDLRRYIKDMGERIRSGTATAEEYFEMGSIMLRKKVFTQVGLAP